MQKITTYNTLAIANKMKKVWKDSDEYDPYKYVCNKLLYLYIDAMKFLGSPLSAVEMIDAALDAHEADFDSHMTSVVFQAMLRFSNAAPAPVCAQNLQFCQPTVPAPVSVAAPISAPFLVWAFSEHKLTYEPRFTDCSNLLSPSSVFLPVATPVQVLKRKRAESESSFEKLWPN